MSSLTGPKAGLPPMPRGRVLMALSGARPGRLNDDIGDDTQVEVTGFLVATTRRFRRIGR